MDRRVDNVDSSSWMLDIYTTIDNTPGIGVVFNETDSNGYRQRVGTEIFGRLNKHIKSGADTPGAHNPRSVPDIWFQTRLWDMFMLNDEIEIKRDDEKSILEDTRNKIIREWQCLLAAVVLNDVTSNNLPKLYEGKKHTLPLNPDEYENGYAKVAVKHRKAQFREDKSMFVENMGDSENVILYSAVWQIDEGGQEREVEYYLAISSPTTIIAPAAEGMNTLGATLSALTDNKWRDNEGNWNFAECATPEERKIMCGWLDSTLMKTILKYEQNKIANYKSNKVFNVDPDVPDFNSGHLYKFIGDILEAQKRKGESISKIRCNNIQNILENGDTLLEIYDIDMIIEEEKVKEEKAKQKENEKKLFTSLEPYKFNIGTTDHYYVPPRAESILHDIDEQRKLELNILTKKDIFRDSAYVMKCNPHEYVDVDDSWSGVDELCIRGGYFVPMPLTEKGHEMLVKGSVDYNATVGLTEGKAAKVSITLPLKIDEKKENENIECEYTLNSSNGYELSELLQSIGSISEVGRLTGALWPKVKVDRWNRYFLHSQNIVHTDIGATDSIQLRPLGGKGKLHAYIKDKSVSSNDGLSALTVQLCYWEMHEFPDYLEFGKMQEKPSKLYDNSEAVAGFKTLGYVKVRTEKEISVPTDTKRYRLGLDFGTSATMCCQQYGNNEIAVLGDGNEDKLEAGRFGAMIPKRNKNIFDFSNDIDARDANTRAAMYFFGKGAFKMPLQSVLHVMTDDAGNSRLAPFLSARLHNPRTVDFGTKHSKGRLISDMKRGGADMNLVRRYIENIVLAAYLDARLKGCNELELNVSFPDTLRNVFGEDYVREVKEAFSSMSGDSGCAYKEGKAITEGEAAARFVNNKLARVAFEEQAYENLYVVDIGGGSCDVAFYTLKESTSNEFIVRHISMDIGARRLLVNSLINSNPSVYKNEKGDAIGFDEADSASYSSLMRIMKTSDVTEIINLSFDNINKICDKSSKDSDYHSDIEKLLTIPSPSQGASEKTIGEDMASIYLERKCVPNSSAAIENFMLHAVIASGFGGIFYCIGLILGGMVHNESAPIRIQMTGNGAKIYHWISKDKNFTTKFMQNMLLKGAARMIDDQDKRNQISNDMTLDYEKKYAKQEAAIGMLSDSFLKCKILLDSDFRDKNIELDINNFTNDLTEALDELYNSKITSESEDEFGNNTLKDRFLSYTNLNDLFSVAVVSDNEGYELNRSRKDIYKVFNIRESDYNSRKKNLEENLTSHDPVGVKSLLALIGSMQANMFNKILNMRSERS